MCRGMHSFDEYSSLHKRTHFSKQYLRINYYNLILANAKFDLERSSGHTPHSILYENIIITEFHTHADRAEYLLFSTRFTATHILCRLDPFHVTQHI